MFRRRSFVACALVLVPSLSAVACGNKVDDHAAIVGGADTAVEDTGIERDTADTRPVVDSSRDVSDGGDVSDGADVADTTDTTRPSGDTSLCGDKTLDGDESDIDCGGSCAACGVGKTCNSGVDCGSGSCTTAPGGKCQPASCTDRVKNGDEVDVDCGGPSCGPCADGLKCTGPTDCINKVCGSLGSCLASTCVDGVTNGKESDTDCGGPCPKCKPGKKCTSNTDCFTDTCNLGQCRCPAGMTIVGTALASGGSYCIDTTEVTNDAYSKFIAASVSLSGQPTQCTWNSNWTPASAWPYVPAAAGFPVRAVDWCDAYGYCKWAGKTLCGLVNGGTVAPADYADHLKSRWYNACSASGTNAYPYGSTYDETKCDGADTAKSFDGGVAGTWENYSFTMSVFTNTTCLGGEVGLYQMSGNVGEWEDACSGASGASDTCLVRGGSYASSGAQLRCDANLALARDSKPDTVGFRCCL